MGGATFIAKCRGWGSGTEQAIWHSRTKVLASDNSFISHEDFQELEQVHDLQCQWRKLVLLIGESLGPRLLLIIVQCC